MRGLQSFRWPVKLAMLVIALLAVIAIGSGWVQIYCRASLIITPHSAVGALTPRPRNDMPAT